MKSSSNPEGRIPPRGATVVPEQATGRGSSTGAGRLAGWHLLFLASGAPGLAAQLAWARIFSGGLGHELPSLLGVVSAFFLGLAAGAWVLDGPVSRSRQPARWYAGLEWFAAVWIAGTATGLETVNGWARAWIGYPASPGWQAVVAMGVTLVVVGPASMAMGGTLAAMDRAVAPWAGGRRAVAGLYAANTAGAMLGVVVTVGWLMPELGFRATLWAAAATQVVCGAVAWWMAGGTATTAEVGAAKAGEVVVRIPRGVMAMACAAGGLGMGYELVGLRALAQTTENTVRTYAVVLVVFLAGTAVGAAGVKWAVRRGWDLSTRWVAGWLGVVLMTEVMVVARSPGWMVAWSEAWGRWGAEVGLALAVFAVPSVGMGVLFAVLAERGRGEGGGVGRVLAANTLGGALGAPLFLGIGLPWVGLKGALVGVGLGYLGLSQPWRKGWARGVVVLGLGLILVLPARVQLLEVPPGAEVRRWDEGMLATVAVVRTADGHRALRVNNHFQQGGTATAAAAGRHAHLPLLLHPAPGRALFLGLGTGITLGSAAQYPGLQVDGVELLPGVVAALPEFEPENGAPGRNPRVRVHVADARRFVRVDTNRYDVVVADLFHPAEDGAGFLYTREHFAALRSRLAPGGLVCQWLPLHQLDQATMQDVVRTFLDVFPDASLWLLRFNADVPVVGLMSGDDRIEASGLGRRLTDPALGGSLRAAGLTDVVRLLGCRLAGTASLRAWAGAGSVATDDRPLVLFRAAAAAYRPAMPAPMKLAELLEAMDPEFPSWTARAVREAEPNLAGRLDAFRRARDGHLGGLAKESAGRTEAAWDAYVASAAASPDYTAGYAQAVLVASAYARQDPALARRLLERLIEARPEQRLARDMLERLGR